MAAKRKLAGRDKLLNPVERRYVEHEIPGYGWIRIQSLTYAEAGKVNVKSWKDGQMSPMAHLDYKARVIAACLVDENGHRMFSDENVEAMCGADAGLVDVIYEHCEHHLEWERVTAKNLSETNGDGSGSDSLQLAAG